MGSEGRWRNRIAGYGEESPSSLLANPQNWRTHPTKQKKILAATLAEVGWVQNVIVNRTTGHMVDGHARVELAVERGEPTVPITYVELTEQEEHLILSVLDPIGGLAGTAQDILDGLIGNVSTEDQDLAKFLQSLLSLDAKNETTQGKADDDHAPAIRTKPTTRQGDVWLLGQHRLLCGDATIQTDVDTLIQNEPVDLIWTDPPYNVAYEDAEGKTIENDDQEASQFREFLDAAFATAYTAIKPGRPIYIAHPDGGAPGLAFRAAMVGAGFYLKQVLIWVKDSFTLGRQDYQWQHEPILYGWKPGAAHTWYGERDKATVIDDEPQYAKLDKPALVAMVRDLRNARNTTIHREPKPSKADLHPTMKPVALVVNHLKNSSRPTDRVLDLFGGSGTTLIACHKLGRRALILELDPIYADAIVRRWQQYTGLPAILETTQEPFDSLEGRQ